MKVGIYISGLGQTLNNDSVVDYAERIKNELKFNTNGEEFELEQQEVSYHKEKRTTVVSIFQKLDQEKKLVYKLYDFEYHQMLTDRFNKFSLLKKNFWLLLLVLQKGPMLFWRIFKRDAFNRPFQTLYIFGIFFLIASSLLLMVPASLSLITGIFESPEISNYFNIADSNSFLSSQSLRRLSEKIIAATGILLVLVPGANVLVTSLATEFVCANDYLDHGSQRQLIQGNLELLVDYITEEQQDCKIHFHTYSFGSLLAMDYLFPSTSSVSNNAKEFCEALITIGTPFEFINSYYPHFYENRNLELRNQLQWINVYSKLDALASNFRFDHEIGEAEYGMDLQSKKPENINYETASFSQTGILSFLLLYSIKAHRIYWDQNPEAQSCIGPIYREMTATGMI
ncbi:MAG: hypothetical protein ACPGRE_10015 [Flavobacteriaceae bacterium]